MVAGRCGDREVADLMAQFRLASLGREEQGLFDALARDLLYAGVDGVLEQAAAIGGGEAYFGWARFDHEVAVLAEPSARSTRPGRTAGGCGPQRPLSSARPDGTG